MSATKHIVDTMPQANRIWAAIGVAGLIGCGQAPPPVPTPTPVQRSVSTPEAIAKAQADSARYPYTEADIRFMTGMISHHAQAITMANMTGEKDRGAAPAVVTLSGRIINAQKDEIALMQTWLGDRRQPVAEPNPNGMRMVMNGVEHNMLMPGMLTPEQLNLLRASRGVAFDELFLRSMIGHHNGATMMVKVLFDTYGAGQDQLVFKFASDVNIDQTTEIARMEKMLASIIFARHSN